MRAFAVLPFLAMVLVGSVVGARLLLQGWRSRRAPELSIGLGLLLITLVGHPLCAVGRLPGLVGTPAGNGFFAVGLVLALSGIACVFVFTWQVFRPDVPWARLLVGAAGVSLALDAVGLLGASFSASTLDEILPRTRPWACGIVATVCVGFLWTAAESLTYWDRLRRRHALGLGDPVVANRFLLWAISGFAVALLCGLLIGCLLAGMVVLIEPLPLSMTALAAITTSIAWYLAFLPPDSYLRLVRGRAGQDAHAVGSPS